MSSPKTGEGGWYWEDGSHKSTCPYRSLPIECFGHKKSEVLIDNDKHTRSVLFCRSKAVRIQHDNTFVEDLLCPEIVQWQNFNFPLSRRDEGTQAQDTVPGAGAFCLRRLPAQMERQTWEATFQPTKPFVIAVIGHGASTPLKTTKKQTCTRATKCPFSHGRLALPAVHVNLLTHPVLGED